MDLAFLHKSVAESIFKFILYIKYAIQKDDDQDIPAQLLKNGNYFESLKILTNEQILCHDYRLH
jgi:hypothetical protein